MVNFCGLEPPKILYRDDNWAAMPTTPDQERIEAILPRFVFLGAIWLHVGIGNSSLAKLYASQIKRLDGITVCRQEIDTAPQMVNYCPCFCDKHTLRFYDWPLYDVIIDTNPCSHACCRKHLYDYLREIFVMLQPSGLFLTDKVGLAWARPTGQGMTPEEFGAVISQYGMTWNYLTDYVIEIKHKEIQNG